MRRCRTVKIRFSLMWLPCLILLPLLHLTKIVLFVFLILSVHEMSHMLAAWLCHYEVEEVTIYPFGFSATIPLLGYGSLVKEIFIISAGPISQVLFPFLFQFLSYLGWISSEFAAYLMMINANTLIFNLLPVYPLDGGRLMQAFFHSLLRYRRAQQMTCIASFLILLALFISQLMNGISALVVQLFLMFQIIVCWKDITHTQLKFYHHRYRHPTYLAPIMNSGNDLYRGRYNVMCSTRGWMEESAWLAKRFGSEQKR